ncbi:MAG: ureidoglycolate lyase [Minwuia sp.]|uniref:ureidoglycolate lyase n=1 Tax=Minwuia sp. TaxID=2493630 RepID=UPI003A83FA99
MTPEAITAVPLTAEAFRPFGDVLEAAGTADMVINGGRCDRFHDRARLTFGSGRAGISIFRSEAVALPCRLDLMERHPIGSQAFLPMTDAPYLVVVAVDEGGRPGPLNAFLAASGQGVNYLAGTWHAPLLALVDGAAFAVVDRIGKGENLEEFALPHGVLIVSEAAENPA